MQSFTDFPQKSDDGFLPVKAQVEQINEYFFVLILFHNGIPPCFLQYTYCSVNPHETRH